MKLNSVQIYKFTGLCILFIMLSVSLHAMNESEISGQFNLVLEDKNLYVEVYLLSSPVIGFDNMPEDENSLVLIKDMLENLENNARIFVLPKNSECFLLNSYTDYLSSESDNYGNNNEAEEIIKSTEAINDLSIFEQSSDQGFFPPIVSDPEVEKIQPFEFYLVYEFRCNKPENISMIPLTLFKNFSEMNSIVFFGTVKGNDTEIIIPKDGNIHIR